MGKKASKSAVKQVQSIYGSNNNEDDESNLFDMMPQDILGA